MDLPTQRYYAKGDRVEYRELYADNSRGVTKGARGTVIENAPISIITGVWIEWDDGRKSVIPCMSARKLTLLELLAEI